MNKAFKWGVADGDAWSALPKRLTETLNPGPMDWALARQLHARLAGQDPHQLALVAACSSAWRQGHACIQIDETKLAELCASMPWCQHQDANSPLVWQEPRLWLRRAWQAEQDIMQALQQRLACRPLPDGQRLAELENACWQGQVHPANASQRKAALAALSQSFTLITGGPGTGKTHVVARILAMRQAESLRTRGKPLRVGLAAPTGKAAARLAQSLAQAAQDLPTEWVQHLPMKATTLHRAVLQASPESPLTQDLWVVDEASMIDLELMAQWLSSLSPHADIVLLGDPDQLASVEAGAVLAQLCDSPIGASHRVHLTHSHRFDPNAGIGQWAALTQTGLTEPLKQAWETLPELSETSNSPETFPTHAVWRCRLPQATFAAQPPKAVAQWIRSGWQKWLEWFQPLRSAQIACSDEQALAGLKAWSAFGVLSAVHQGSQGVDGLNAWVNTLLDLPPADAAGWFAGRPVMVQQNLPQLGLMNGDVGLCLPFEVEGQIRLRVAFAQPHLGHTAVKWLPPSMVHPVQTAWAMTVHKSQGSEFDRLLIVIPNEDMPLMTREWFYTALTRAKQTLAIWSSNPEVWLNAVERPTQRLGGLSDWRLSPEVQREQAL